MSIAGTIDAPLDLFGGLVTDLAAADLPQGVSPDCRDVAFQQGAVKTRPGLLSVYSPIAGNPTVNYLKTFTQPNLVKTLLAMDSDIIANISAISRTSNIVTETTATPTGLLSTDQVIIAGVTDTTYNGTV